MSMRYMTTWKRKWFVEHIVFAATAHHHLYFTDEAEFWTGEVTYLVAHNK